MATEMAAGPDGGLYVSIPARAGPATLVLLDREGRPRPGWPIAIKHSTWCARPLPADDGSVRVICDGTDLALPDYGVADVRAYSFDTSGRMMDGWPVQLHAPAAFGVGTDLTLVTERSETDNVSGGVTLHDASVTTVAADGTVREGTTVGLPKGWFGMAWHIGPDGVAYAVAPSADHVETSTVGAMDRAGWRAGWPVTIEGLGSMPGFGPDGRLAVVQSSAKPNTSRISVFDAGGKRVTSGVLPITTAERSGDTGGCTVGGPQAPLVAGNGAVFVYSELDRSIYGLTPSLAIMKGWPFEPATPLATARPGLESEHEAGYCPTPVVPGVGPDGTLILSLKARASNVGGSLVAVGTDGRVRPGWPLALKRPGSEFWSVVVGADGTVFALAIEPESGGKSSASILAIAPDSTVRWTTTIVEP